MSVSEIQDVHGDCSHRPVPICCFYVLNEYSIPPHHLDSTDTMASFESLFNQTTQGVKGNLNRLKHRFKSLCYQYIYTITDPIFPTYQRRNILHLKIY